MTRTFTGALRLAIAAALAAAAVPAAAKDPAKIAITPGSPNGAVILKAAQLPPPPGYASGYRISLQTYDPAEKTMRGGPYGGGATFAAKRKAFVDGYMVLEMKPGTYAFHGFSRQDYWALCFNGGSLSFNVQPGEVVYLGEMDVAMHAEELQRLAITSGRVSTTGSNPVHFFDTVTPPAVAVDEAGLAGAAAMVKARMPKTTVAPKAATYAPARFGTGNDLFGLQRICGGYYQKKAK